MQQPTLPDAHSDFSPSHTAATTEISSFPFLSLFQRLRTASHSFTLHTFRGFTLHRLRLHLHSSTLPRLRSPFNYFHSTLASNATTLKGSFGCVGHRVGYLAFFVNRRTFTQALLAVTHLIAMSSSDDDMPLARGKKPNGLSNGTNGTNGTIGTFSLLCLWLLSLSSSPHSLPEHVNAMPKIFHFCLTFDSSEFTFISSN